MRVLLVGTNTPGALERYCEAALAALGHTVTWHDTNLRRRFQQTPVLSEAEFALLRRRFNRALVEAVKQQRPDLLLVFKGVELTAATLGAIRKLPGRPLLANWNPDSPFDYATANTNPQIIASIPCYDAYFIWDRDLFSPLREAGSPRPEYLPFAYDPAYHHPIDVEKSLDVCFVGGYTPERAARLTEVVEAGHTLGVWGTNWERLPQGSPVRASLRGGWTSGEAMSRVFCSARVVLNFIRAQNGQAHNMRTFEAPATRSVMLATRTRDQRRWLPEGQAAAYFETPAEMLAQLRALLADNAARQQMAAGGYTAITGGDHTYIDRMRHLIETIESI